MVWSVHRPTVNLKTRKREKKKQRNVRQTNEGRVGTVGRYVSLHVRSPDRVTQWVVICLYNGQSKCILCLQSPSLSRPESRLSSLVKSPQAISALFSTGQVTTVGWVFLTAQALSKRARNTERFLRKVKERNRKHSSIGFSPLLCSWWFTNAQRILETPIYLLLIDYNLEFRI